MALILKSAGFWPPGEVIEHAEDEKLEVGLGKIGRTPELPWVEKYRLELEGRRRCRCSKDTIARIFEEFSEKASGNIDRPTRRGQDHARLRCRTRPELRHHRDERVRCSVFRGIKRKFLKPSAPGPSPIFSA